jgi:hypothetical protein
MTPSDEGFRSRPIIREGCCRRPLAQPARAGLAPPIPLYGGLSVVDGLDAQLLEAFDIVLHGPEDVGGMPFPVCEFACDK